MRASTIPLITHLSFFRCLNSHTGNTAETGVNSVSQAFRLSSVRARRARIAEDFHRYATSYLNREIARDRPSRYGPRGGYLKEKGQALALRATMRSSEIRGAGGYPK